MAEAEQRSIEELVTRYEFEPGLKDIYVEGSDDKAILEGILEEQGVVGVSVFEISAVNVPRDAGEDTGCRTKVIKLSEALAEAFQGNEPHVVCIIDSDLDHATGGGEHNALLLKSDYTDMEMYFFTSDVFDKFNRQCIRGSKLTNYMINGFMRPTLQALFLIRLVNDKPEWHLTHYEFRRVISFAQGRFGFNRDKYVERYLNKNGCLRRRNEFLRQVEAVELPDGLDRRCFIHGNDFLSLLRLMLNKLRGRSVYGSEEVVFTLLRGCANYASLAEEPLFANILRRFE